MDAPEDEALIEEIAGIRTLSPGHERFYQDTKRIWEASAETRRLQDVDIDRALNNFKDQLGPDDHYKARSWFSWPRLAAASVLFCAFGVWAYQHDAKADFLIKETKLKVDSLILGDGTKIMMAENTKISYPETFGDEDRQVILNRGKAFFSVARDTNRPFEVAIRQSVVKVLGTSFNIDYSDTAIELGVKTGKVMFTPNEKSSPAILLANQAINYNYVANTLQQEDGQNANAWLTKELHFIDMPLDQVCTELSNYYGVQIILDDKGRNHKKFNANFKDVNLEDALLLLKETYSISIKQENQHIIIKSL